MDLLDIAIAKQLAGGGGGSGTDNYNDLSNLPKINDTTLSGNKTSANLGLQSEINSDSKLASDLVDDTDQDNKFVTTTEKNTWNGKQNAIDSDHKLSSDLVDDANKTNKFVTSTEKNTWNAKQNAIDSDHKLSSSLVSFTDAEAAAIASGIDSSKVGQISTNQTNILYAINTGVKNILPVNVNALKAINSNGSWTENSYLYNGVRYTVNADGSITITRVSSSSSDSTFNLEMSVRNKYVGYYLSGGSDYCAIIMLTSGGNTALAVRTIASAVPSNATGNMNLYVRSSDNPDNNTVYPMISYMNDSEYMPFARPNYDLTVREAEDRAALVEQVDEGAKNLLEIPVSQTVRNFTFTKDADDWVTSDASADWAAWTAANSNVSLNLKAGTYIVVATSHANNTETCEFSIMDSNSTKISGGGINYGQQETFTVMEFTINSAMTVYIMYKLKTQKCRFMICTKAKYNISPNYEPYALPNITITPALADVVNMGAKNLINIADVTTTGSDYVFDVTYINPLPAGSYVFSYTSNQEESGNIQLLVRNGDAILADPTILSKSGRNIIPFTISSTADNIILYTVRAGTYSDLMLCTKAEYDISEEYKPFALPNTDLTRMMTPFFTVPINHNMIYRGANLGDTLTADQDTALSSGNFTDLYLGDYWTKAVTIPAGTYTGGDGEEVTIPAQTNITLKAVIADFDTFYAGYASTYAGINTHHAAVIVTGFGNVVWNKTNSTAGGYEASLIHKWLSGSVLPQIETWFGSAKVLSHQKRLTNAITGDAASEWAWSSQKISLLSENQIYGSKIWGGSKATNGAYEPGEAFKHLNVFNHIDVNLLFGDKNMWLREIASAVGASCLSNDGGARIFDASNTLIAPAALILLS